MKRPHLMTINNKLSVNDPHHMELPRLPAFIIVLVVLTSSRQDPMLHPRSSVYFRTSVELHRRGLWTRSLTCGSRFGVFSLRFHLLMARISLTLIICIKIFLELRDNFSILSLLKLIHQQLPTYYSGLWPKPHYTEELRTIRKSLEF